MAGYTKKQLDDAGKLCETLERVPKARRSAFTNSILAYISGLEAGIALEKAAQSKPTAQREREGSV